MIGDVVSLLPESRNSIVSRHGVPTNNHAARLSCGTCGRLLLLGDLRVRRTVLLSDCSLSCQVSVSSLSAGSEGHTLWAEALGEDATMPPNISDTLFRLVPKLKYTKEDSGEKLEQDRTNAETVRQSAGKKLRFGDSLQIQHVRTGLFVAVFKDKSIERGYKKVRLVEGSAHCAFVLLPAFKTFSTGDPVYSVCVCMCVCVCVCFTLVPYGIRVIRDRRES